MNRRSILSLLALGSWGPLSLTARADNWPTARLALVAPSAAGGNGDLIGRTIAQPLSQALNIPVIVEARPGATGAIASAFVAKSPADGGTLMIGSVATHAIAPHINKNLSYDVVSDFTPIAMIGANRLVLAVSASSPYHTVGDLLAAVKANAGGLSFASPGVGGTSHLSGVEFQRLTGTKLIHVPNSRNPPHADVIAGHATMLFEGTVALLPHIRSGLLRPLAVTSVTRSTQLPQVPTLAESGVAGFDIQSWQALLGPAGLPPPISERLYREISKILQMPDVQQRLAQMGISQRDMGPAALAAFQRQEIAKWATIVKAANAIGQ